MSNRKKRDVDDIVTEEEEEVVDDDLIETSDNYDLSRELIWYDDTIDPGMYTCCSVQYQQSKMIAMHEFHAMP